MIVGWRGTLRCAQTMRLTPLKLIPAESRLFLASSCSERSPLRVPPNGTNLNRFALLSSQADDPGRHRVFTIPNALCVFRIGMTPVIGSLVVTGSYTPALSLFVVAAITDMLDGLIARNVRGQKSLLGSVLDPVADKLLVGTLFITCTYAALIPVPLTALVLTRDVSLIVGGFYKRYQTMHPPITLSRFFDSRVSSMQIVPTLVSKVNTVLQLSVVTFALVVPIVEAGPLMDHFFSALCVSTGITTLWSGLQYASGKAIRRI
ncbi:hypothetical protein PENTCL1PPCAC_2798 [Pristionchus entomophagus]|uniref:cardiolipin synthase (CMP-forming) n=1 Tax=Pristionchus entomophagus TaxID=358040 RepID=A0AAV5SJ09_9BILA|nr:hypothetical protein PENTCL1PPCAC_2798 [Pristionchus entomophagus]